MKFKTLFLSLTIILANICVAHNTPKKVICVKQEDPKLKKRVRPSAIENNELSTRYKEIKGLIYRIQITLPNAPDELAIKKAAMVGGLKKLTLKDGIVRYVTGYEFSTLPKAQFHREKAMGLFNKNASILATYKGKRISLDELGKMGVY